MPRMKFKSLVGAIVVSLIASIASAADAPVVYSRDVLPILSDHCYQCHGPSESSRKAGFRLDVESSAKQKNSNGIIPIVAGNPNDSAIISHIQTHDAKELMPPAKANKPLKPAEIAVIRRWVEQGATWGRHWAFDTLAKPAIPDGDQRQAIDFLVQARLKREGLTQSPAASKQTLIRRLTLDLTGLPPTPEEVDAFVSDQSADAYEKLVDRLLASPHFGERMAWDWLDAARYADSNGYQGDQERTMWPWRDWVIKAYNSNLPINDFTVWQLAGDLLPNSTTEQKVATAFCRNHMINGEGGRIAEENRIDYVMDMTETTGTIWLGLTFNCCRCHDHKFDPLARKDYYSLLAFFNQTPIDGGGGNPQTPPVLDMITDADRQRIASAEAELAKINAQIKTHKSETSADQLAWEKKILAEAEKKPSVWKQLDVVSMKAEHQKLSKSPDGAIYAAGPNPNNDTYTIIARIPSLQRVTAIRLDALRHPEMTKGALARSDSGNFVLTSFEIALKRPGEAAPAPLTIASAAASYEQGQLKIANTIDGSNKLGWAVLKGKTIDRDHQGVFRLAKPIDLEPDSEIIITMRHDSTHASHNIGYFRLSATDAAKPGLGTNHDNLVAALAVPPGKRTAAIHQRIAEAYPDDDPEYKSLLARKDEKDKAIATIRKQATRVMVMADMPTTRPTFILEKGQYDKPTVQVEPRVPSQLGKLPDKAPLNRLSMARWLVSQDNPLTPRVLVNRVWQQFFGIGLVKTPDDFGLQGERPIQPELMEYLAADFRDSNWDLKRLCKQIVMSQTYRQSSRVSAEMAERDPQNRLLARGPRFRMPSWMLRDQALAASGLLVPTVGGPSVKPYQPEGVWEEATFGQKRYVQDHGDALYRRSLYTFWRRIVGPTMFFDNASRQVCTVKVFRTNTPLHSLITLNESTFVESSRALAQRVMLAAPDDAARIDLACRLVLGRHGSADESGVLLKALSRYRAQFHDDSSAARQLLTIGESKPDARLDPADHAAMTLVCSTIFNLDEALTKE